MLPFASATDCPIRSSSADRSPRPNSGSVGFSARHRQRTWQRCRWRDGRETGVLGRSAWWCAGRRGWPLLGRHAGVLRRRGHGNERMPQGVRTYALGDPRLSGDATHDPSGGMTVESLTGRVRALVGLGSGSNCRCRSGPPGRAETASFGRVVRCAAAPRRTPNRCAMPRIDPEVVVLLDEPAPVQGTASVRHRLRRRPGSAGRACAVSAWPDGAAGARCERPPPTLQRRGSSSARRRRSRLKRRLTGPPNRSLRNRSELGTPVNATIMCSPNRNRR
jgi:hypothetical protein